MTNAEAWDYAIGMIRVDGLEPTEDLKKYIEKEKTGEATMEDVKKFLDKKYKMKEPAYKYISLMKISMSAKADVPSDSLNHRTRKKGRGKPTQKENQLYQKNR
jgi:hypothetical protein